MQFPIFFFKATFKAPATPRKRKGRKVASADEAQDPTPDASAASISADPDAGSSSTAANSGQPEASNVRKT